MRSRLPVPLAALLLAWLLAVPAAAADVPSHTVPEVRPIQLDGSPAKPEWAEALALELVPGTTVHLQQFRGTVMLALASDRLWPEGSVLTCFFCPNGPQAGGRGPGCLRIDYEPFRHDRPHVIAYRYDAAAVAERLVGGVVARQTIGDHGAQVEMAFPAALLGLTRERRFPVRLCVQWARRGATSLTYPPGLDFHGSPPPDFVAAGRWALLEGFGDPEAPGAFPAADWKAWAEHDAELARRGRAAHDRIALLTEEWKKEDKRDDEMLAEVVGNLEWIRAHEPLTAEDVFAKATLWRYLGRHRRAATALGTLIDTSRRPAVVLRALHQRALVHRAWERFDAEASDWRELARRVGAQGAVYLQQAEQADALAETWAQEQAARRAVEADPANPRVHLETVRGPIEVVLHAEATPEAVKHFLALVEAEFYDGTLFHRVKGDFMAQGGDPKSRELGCEFAGPGSSPTEIPMEINPRHGFFRGALCFARPGHKEENGSQFFLMTAPKPDLGRYTIFGHVVLGMEAVDRLEMCDALTEARRLGR